MYIVKSIYYRFDGRSTVILFFKLILCNVDICYLISRPSRLIIIYLFIYLFINQTLFSAPYTMTSGQLYIIYNCSNLNKISLSNAMICRIEQKSFQFLFEKLGVRDQSDVNGQAIPRSWCSDGERPL